MRRYGPSRERSRTVSSCGNRGMRDCAQHQARRQETRQGTEHHIRGRHRLPGNRHPPPPQPPPRSSYPPPPSPPPPQFCPLRRSSLAVAVTPRSRLDPPYAAAECAASKGAHARRRTGRLRASADTVHGLDCGRHSDSDHRLRRPHSRGQTGSVSLQPVRAREPTHKHMAGLRLGAARAVWTADLGRNGL